MLYLFNNNLPDFKYLPIVDLLRLKYLANSIWLTVASLVASPVASPVAFASFYLNKIQIKTIASASGA